MFERICANTNVEDALIACALGADAVGSSSSVIPPE
jgi:hypothetical protein